MWKQTDGLKDWSFLDDDITAIDNAIELYR